MLRTPVASPAPSSIKGLVVPVTLTNYGIIAPTSPSGSGALDVRGLYEQLAAAIQEIVYGVVNGSLLGTSGVPRLITRTELGGDSTGDAAYFGFVTAREGPYYLAQIQQIIVTAYAPYTTVQGGQTLAVLAEGVVCATVPSGSCVPNQAAVAVSLPAALWVNGNATTFGNSSFQLPQFFALLYEPPWRAAVRTGIRPLSCLAVLPDTFAGDGGHALAALYTQAGVDDADTYGDDAFSEGPLDGEPDFSGRKR